jgi:hypothetical protein
MGESKSPINVGTGPEQMEKFASNADQKEKEKYQSQPEEKVALGDYLVRMRSQFVAECETNPHLATSGSSRLPQNGILYY